MDNDRELTQKRLKEALLYGQDTGIFLRRTKSKGLIKAGTLNHGYIHIRLDGKIYQAHRLAWLYVYGAMPINLIDHTDRNPSNNKISNLREATSKQNSFNTKKFITNTSGVKGVYWSKSTNKWQASIRVDGSLKHLGVFIHKDDAVNARQKAATQYYREFANNG